jgi:hypothetical protein
VNIRPVLSKAAATLVSIPRSRKRQSLAWDEAGRTMSMAIAMAAERDVRLNIGNFLEVVFKDAMRELSKLRPIDG